MNPVRLGIIGCGNVLSAYRVPIDKLRLGGFAQVTVACGREHQQEAASACLGTVQFTTHSQDVIQSENVDLVLILTSMGSHAPLAEQALQAGKHVIVEKPLATTLEEANRLLELAHQKKRHLVCAPFTILSPTFQTISRRIQNGDIGKPCLARARYGWAGPWWSEWFYTKSGGCLFDLGVYCITTLTGLLGPARTVSAMMGTAIPQREINGAAVPVEVEDNAQVLLDFGNNTLAVITTGFTMQQYRTPAIEIYGTIGTIQMGGDDWDPDGYELWQNSVGAWQLFKETTPDWPWTDGLPHTVESLIAGKEPMVPPTHARHVLEIMLKARQSAREGRAMTIESTFKLPQFLKQFMDEPAHLMHDRSREHVT